MANYECENTAHEHGANNFFQSSHGAGLEQRETSNVVGDSGQNPDQCTQESTLVLTVSHFPSERLDPLLSPGQTDKGTKEICAYPLPQMIEHVILKLKFVKPGSYLSSMYV